MIELFDEAIRWLVERGQPGQWGATPYSQRPDGRARVEAILTAGESWIAVDRDQALGAVVLGSAPAYVPAAVEHETYVNLLITSRRHAGRQIGTRLLANAGQRAAARGHRVLRVDCWAGAPGLVAWYARHGFAPTDIFELTGWPGQVLLRRL